MPTPPLTTSAPVTVDVTCVVVVIEILGTVSMPELATYLRLTLTPGL